MKSLTRCPYCGSERGYYSKQMAQGPITYNYNFDGSEADNEQMYECLQIRDDNGRVYCQNCNTEIPELNTRKEVRDGK